jgi:hypothetical protein
MSGNYKVEEHDSGGGGWDEIGKCKGFAASDDSCCDEDVVMFIFFA